MIVHVTYPGTVHVLGPRQRVPRQRRRVATVPVEVRELTDVEAPVALVWRVQGRERHLRWADGFFLSPVRERSAEGARAVAGCDVGWLVERGANGWLAGAKHRDRDHDPFRAAPEVAAPREPHVENGWFRVVEDDGDGHETRIREAAGRLRLVDGYVHEEAPEPVYAVTVDPATGRAVLDMVPSGLRVGPAATYWRLDETEAVRSSYPDLVGRRGAPADLLRPEVPRAPVLGHELLFLASDLVTALGERLPQADLACFRAYRALRDAVSSFRAEDMHVDPLLLLVEAGLPFVDVTSGTGATLAERTDAVSRRMPPTSGGIRDDVHAPFPDGTRPPVRGHHPDRTRRP